MIDTSLCLTCGTDTLFYGYVNRIPSFRTNIEGYMCGGCAESGYPDYECPKGDDCPIYQETGDCECEELSEFSFEAFDEFWEIHVPVIDKYFPQSPIFRDMMDNEENWTTEECTTVQNLINNYRKSEIA